MQCRYCNLLLEHTFADLGRAPLSNAYLVTEDLSKPEKHYPLNIKVCDRCWLVQTEDYVSREEIFDANYAYFSSVSSSWLKHAEDYFIKICKKLNLNEQCYVIEIASNDGYLLKHFVSQGIHCVGIEPTDSTATAAERLGIPVIRQFFDSKLAEELTCNHQQADLIIGNNVYAHVPDVNDFTLGMKMALKPAGTVTLEFSHLLNLIEYCQFDTIYHEHYSYLSLYTVQKIFTNAGLRIFDVDILSTHGGSLRIYGCHENDPRNTSKAVTDVIEHEEQKGLRNLATYQQYQERIQVIKKEFIAFLREQKQQNKLVVAYGAAAKGNMLLNFAGITADLIPWVCDNAQSKQGKYLPGSRIPIVHPQILSSERPDFVIIMPWNIADEIRQQHAYIRAWGGRFVVAMPGLSIL